MPFVIEARVPKGGGPRPRVIVPGTADTVAEFATREQASKRREELAPETPSGYDPLVIVEVPPSE